MRPGRTDRRRPARRDGSAGGASAAALGRRGPRGRDDADRRSGGPRRRRRRPAGSARPATAPVRLTVEEAAATTPVVVEAIGAAGGEVARTRRSGPRSTRCSRRWSSGRAARPSHDAREGRHSGSSSLIGKELVDTFRRPGAVLSLVLGPFIILALFGFGYDSVRDPFRAVVVVPPDSGSADRPRDLGGLRGRRHRHRRGRGRRIGGGGPAAARRRARPIWSSRARPTSAPPSRPASSRSSVIEYDIIDPDPRELRRAWRPEASAEVNRRS